MSYLESSVKILKLTAPQMYAEIERQVNAGRTRKQIEELAPYHMKSLVGQVADYLIEQKRFEDVK